MSKKVIGVIGLIAVVALIVAIIGLYLPVAQKKLGQAMSSVIGVGGPPTGVTELSFADGEVERFGKRELKMNSGTSTITFDNRSEDDLLIYSPTFVIPSSASSTRGSFVWVLATTTFQDDLAEDSNININADAILANWLTATGTSGTSTSVAELKHAEPIAYSSIVNSEGTSKVRWPILLQANHRLILRIYNLVHISLSDGPNKTTEASNAASATSTGRGFDPILKFDYESVD